MVEGSGFYKINLTVHNTVEPYDFVEHTGNKAGFNSLYIFPIWTDEGEF